MYQVLYGKASMYEALDDWNDIAKDVRISGAAMAYRWITYHSSLEKGDGVIIGARNVAQLQETLAAIDAGPLDADIARRASDIWEKVKSDAPRDNWQDYISLKL